MASFQKERPQHKMKQLKYVKYAFWNNAQDYWKHICTQIKTFQTIKLCFISWTWFDLS